MARGHTKPDAIGYNALINAAVKAGDTARAERWLAAMIKALLVLLLKLLLLLFLLLCYYLEETKVVSNSCFDCVFYSQFFRSSNPPVDRRSNPLPWDPLSSL